MENVKKETVFEIQNSQNREVKDEKAVYVNLD